MSNYRVTIKLWEKVVEKQIRHVSSVKDNQFGYIAQRSIPISSVNVNYLLH